MAEKKKTPAFSQIAAKYIESQKARLSVGCRSRNVA